MYRREQRRIKEMEDQQQVISRVSNYPVVKDAWTKMSEVYQRGKDGSRVLRFCGGVVESGANLAYRTSQPVIEKLPVEMVNDYAVSKLESLEESYPVIVKPTDQVVDAVKTYSTTKLDEVKTYGTSKLDSIAAATGMGTVLGLAECAVESVLPDPDLEESEKPVQTAVTTDQGAVERTVALGDKVKRRAYTHAMAKVGVLRQRTDEAMSKLTHTIDLIAFAKNLTERPSYEGVKDKVKSVYNEIISDEEIEQLEPTATLERKAIVSAQIFTRRVRTAVDGLSKFTYALPASTRSSISSALQSTEAIYHLLTDYEALSNRGNDYVDQLKAHLDSLKTHLIGAGVQLLQTTQNIVRSTPLASLPLVAGVLQMACVEELPPPRLAACVVEDSEDSEDEDDDDYEQGGVDDTYGSANDDSMLDSTRDSDN